MSEVFEGYERQYCELSANLSRKCTSAGLLDGGMGCIPLSLCNFLVLVELNICRSLGIRFQIGYLRSYDITSTKVV
uniref:Vesicle transport v-SNARE N-terminal domain-containing protein n=1 Tax=Nelumbo nucifera TaxID=4432 RepID=A0A822YTS2_NELNU|nr:TPA_asm: hypothetical protein HUJ06_005581 [Nelumbo nucifera]